MRYKSKTFRRQYSAMADINVTPMVDVMLVLLIIFMVAAPLSQYGMEIKLPSVQAKAIHAEQKWTLTIYRNRSMFLNNKQILMGALENQLKEKTLVNPAMEVFLKADEALPYGFVVTVMSSIRRAGVVNLGVITEPLTITP